ncbi:MAG TPA: tetratricopeptide repeat protein [Pyrinomonadaceae bacterium]|nr:tetratricopeptide repeat protein [Pyrinomonadaceae bacterium]
MRRTCLDFLKAASSERWRLRPIILAALIALTSIAVHAQVPANDRLEQKQLIALVREVRANPSNAGKLAEARAVGFELLRAARYAEAVEVFDAIVDGQPGDGLSLYGGAVALFNLRRLEEAERVARDAVRVSVAATARPSGNLSTGEQLKDQAAEALTLLGVILAVKGDSAGALSSVTKAAALAPKNFDAQLALGRALFGTGNPSGAASVFRTAVALRPQDTKARFFLATALETAGDYDNALVEYRGLLAIDKESAEGHLGLGVLLVKLGGERTKEGIEALARAIALNGDLYEARITIGRALIQQGRPAEAVEHLRRAVELAPKNPEPHYQLALAYRRLGKTQEAAEQEAIIQKLHAERRGE